MSRTHRKIVSKEKQHHINVIPYKRRPKHFDFENEIEIIIERRKA